jgi:hypothetical protein
VLWRRLQQCYWFCDHCYRSFVSQVELLKVRFGEQAFSACDVMIKDIQVEPPTPPPAHPRITVCAGQPPPARTSQSIWRNSGIRHTLVVQGATDPHTARYQDVSNAVQVLSSEFWPKDLLGPVEEAATAVALHPKLQQLADAFTEQVAPHAHTRHTSHLTRSRQYKILKRPRNLKWRHGVSLLSITCTMEDGRVEQLLVQPLHVTMLLLLQVWRAVTACQ